MHAPADASKWEAVFGPIPGFGHLFRLRRPPTQTDNRSVAIVQAVLEPTAMDLFQSLTFEYDRNTRGEIIREEHDPKLHVVAREYHKDYIRCILNGTAKSPCMATVPARPLPKAPPKE